jgi:hypothetical protein
LTGTSGAPARGFFSVDKSLFTNDGIKKEELIDAGDASPEPIYYTDGHTPEQRAKDVEAILDWVRSP